MLHYFSLVKSPMYFKRPTKELERREFKLMFQIISLDPRAYGTHNIVVRRLKRTLIVRRIQRATRRSQPPVVQLPTYTHIAESEMEVLDSFQVRTHETGSIQSVEQRDRLREILESRPVFILEMTSSLHS